MTVSNGDVMRRLNEWAASWLPWDRDAPAVDVHLSPDCGVAKCSACSGDAWDFTTDQPTPCTCPCHGDTT
jgi:hypothetical protein